jgi:hypothetical protein
VLCALKTDIRSYFDNGCKTHVPELRIPAKSNAFHGRDVAGGRPEEFESGLVKVRMRSQLTVSIKMPTGFKHQNAYRLWGLRDEKCSRLHSHAGVP